MEKTEKRIEVGRKREEGKRSRSFAVNFISKVAVLGVFLTSYFLPLFSVQAASDSAFDILSRLPVQHEGRIKPFESFAREAAVDVTGATSYQGIDATELVWRWMSAPDEWHTKAMIPVAYRPLREEFKPMLIQKKLSPEIITQHEPFLALVQEASEKNKQKETLTQIERERLSLYGKARLFQDIAAGAVPGWIAHPEDPRVGWLAFNGFGTEEGQRLLAGLYPAEETLAVNESIRDLLFAVSEQGAAVSNDLAVKFETSLKNLLESRGVVLDEAVLKSEMTYNALQPFSLAWKLYLLGVLLVFVLSFLGTRAQVIAAVTSFGAGFLFHTYGFYLRCIISGRPPVTNMYESVIWVSWACVLFALVLFIFYRSLLIPVTAALVGTFALLVAGSFPAVLGPEISPLVPVLRSNLWLTVHVLTITLSYGAFALAWGLGHVVVYRYAQSPEKAQENKTVSQFMYRAVQIGVILLAAGTVLGGVWANYSWGRFWGWDPKETWALIALLGYLTVLHGRFSGWFQVFGMAVGAVVAFALVVMAWYGVNFVLAAGLHSYGFGGGGAPYVLSVAVADLLLIGWWAYQYRKKKAQLVSL